MSTALAGGAFVTESTTVTFSPYRKSSVHTRPPDRGLPHADRITAPAQNDASRKAAGFIGSISFPSIHEKVVQVGRLDTELVGRFVGENV
jgi:hypothetical protein